jgi:hypothetical protein
MNSSRAPGPSFRHVQDDEVRVVVAEVGAVAVDEGVVRGVPLALGPGRLLTALDPLAGPPPLSDRDGSGRVGHVDDDPDAVVKARRGGRHVRVPAALPHDPVDAPAPGLPEADLFRVERVLEGVDGEPRRPRALRTRWPEGEALVVDQQQPAGDLHLVRMGVRRRVPLADQAGTGRVGHVQDGRARTRGAVVSDVQDVTLAEHLHPVPTAVQVVLREQPQPLGRGRTHCHCMSARDGRSSRPRAF